MKGMYWVFKMCTSQLDLSNGLLEHPKQRSYAKVVPPEVDVSTNHIEAHKPFGVSSSRVRFLDV
jgi:hypothetical protein